LLFYYEERTTTERPERELSVIFSVLINCFIAPGVGK
jgi:hypothetical protein